MLPRRLLVGPSLALLLIGAGDRAAWSADKKSTLAQPAADSPAMASEKSSVKPAAERAIAGGAVGRSAKPGGAQQAGSKSSRGPMGPRIPEHMRKALEGLIARRIDRDIIAQKSLRAEAVGLLETFIKEESVQAREMPEAMMRLGELYWETEREQFVLRFQEWEKKPVDQRGPTPDPNFDRARALFARVLKDY